MLRATITENGSKSMQNKSTMKNYIRNANGDAGGIINTNDYSDDDDSGSDGSAVADDD